MALQLCAQTNKRLTRRHSYTVEVYSWYGEMKIWKVERCNRFLSIEGPVVVVVIVVVLLMSPVRKSCCLQPTHNTCSKLFDIRNSYTSITVSRY